MVSLFLLIPTRKRLAKRATEGVAAYTPFKRLLNFIEARRLDKIKRIFPNLFQILCRLGLYLSSVEAISAAHFMMNRKTVIKS
jgi:hypothetical protein